MMKKTVIIIVVLLVVLLGAVFILAGKKSQNDTNGNVVNDVSVTSADSSARVIQLTASRFTYTPSVVRVKLGEKVKIVVDNTDTPHGILIPDLNVRGMDSVEFTADKAGTFQFRCPTMCGLGHRNMTGTLIVQ